MILQISDLGWVQWIVPWVSAEPMQASVAFLQFWRPSVNNPLTFLAVGLKNRTTGFVSLTTQLIHLPHAHD